jgi:hypothetical protein
MIKKVGQEFFFSNCRCLFVPTLYTYRKKNTITGNGYITTSVLREILHELDDKLTPDDLDGIIAEIDEDGSGTIDFDGKT